MNRRGFLAGILASGFAPAAVGSGVLMPVRRILLPEPDGLTLAKLLRARDILLELEVPEPYYIADPRLYVCVEPGRWQMTPIKPWGAPA